VASIPVEPERHIRIRSRRVVTERLAMAPVSPPWIDPRLSADLEIVCLKCREKELAWRYPTALGSWKAPIRGPRF
jgi:hypothetical protein